MDQKKIEQKFKEKEIDIKYFVQAIRKIIVEQSYRAKIGHIGSALCIVELLAVLYEKILNISGLSEPDRDRFILSKGHAALALYAILFLKDWISKEELNSFCSDNTLLGVHPEAALKGIDFSTGSLGQGLSMGVGAALASKIKNKPYCVFVLLSDAECNEGSIWEAVMFAAHHKLSNLIVIVDDNGQQALGYTKTVLNITPLENRFKAFGWDAHSIDGHDTLKIEKKLLSLSSIPDKPHIIIAKTIFGKGISFMHNKIEWHYLPLSEELYHKALNEIGVSIA